MILYSFFTIPIGKYLLARNQEFCAHVMSLYQSFKQFAKPMQIIWIDMVSLRIRTMKQTRSYTNNSVLKLGSLDWIE